VGRKEGELTIVPAEHFTYTPLKYFEIDLTKEGIPANAKLLYVNISQEGDGTGPILMMAQVIGYQLRSIAEIPLTLRLVPILRNPADDLLGIDLNKKHRANLYVRWRVDTGNEIISDHLIRCVEGYWKKDLNQVVYNGFAAFELTMTSCLQLFWSKVKSIDEANYERLFGRDNIHKKMTTHLSVLCKELGVDISDDVKRKLKLIDELRILRNDIVHTGQVRPGTPPDQQTLFAGLCWGLLFLQMLSDKINTRKKAESGRA